MIQSQVYGSTGLTSLNIISPGHHGCVIARGDWNGRHKWVLHTCSLVLVPHDSHLLLMMTSHHRLEHYGTEVPKEPIPQLQKGLSGHSDSLPQALRDREHNGQLAPWIILEAMEPDEKLHFWAFKRIIKPSKYRWGPLLGSIYSDRCQCVIRTRVKTIITHHAVNSQFAGPQSPSGRGSGVLQNDFSARFWVLSTPTAEKVLTLSRTPLVFHCLPLFS